MKNFVQEGEVVTVTAPYDRLSGQGVLVGALFGVACFDALSGADLEIAREGAFKLEKTVGAGTAIAQGAKVYWDASAKKVTGVVGSNVHIGYGLIAAIDADTTATIVTIC